jgi:phage terminase large subunit-like protein
MQNYTSKYRDLEIPELLLNSVPFQFAFDVLEGRFVAGEFLKLAVVRFFEDLIHAGERDFVLDHDAGMRIVNFFPRFLKHTKGKFAGKPFVLAPHQSFELYNIFGWKHKATGLRRFKEVYNEEAKKNGKTAKLAGLAIYMLGFDGEQGAQVFSFAVEKAQARLSFEQAQEFIRVSADLRKAGFEAHNYRIKHVPSNSYFVALARDKKDDKNDGINTYLGIADEYHAHPDNKIYEIVESSMASREQPLMYKITTAGFNKNGPCYQNRKVAIQILRGNLTDDTSFVILYSLDATDNPHDPKNWIKANPNLGVTVIQKNLEESLVKAKNEASKMPTWLTKNMNIWTDSYATWIDNKYWEQGEVEFDDKYFSEGVYLGFDIASTTDITCLAISASYQGNKYTDYRFYIPLDNLEQRNEDDKFMYKQWINEGHLITTPGKTIDHDYLVKEVLELRDKYQIIEAGADPWGMIGIEKQFSKEGLELTKVTQNMATLSAPTKAFQKMLLDGTFKHFGNKVMGWMMTNVVVHTDVNENIKLRKERDEDKIDGPIATVVALAVMLADNGDNNESKYNNETIIFS